MPAKPPAMLSTPMATNRAGSHAPFTASQAKTRLLKGPAKAPMTMALIRPKRATARPPRKTPAMDMTTPNTFRTSATSVRVKPRSR